MAQRTQLSARARSSLWAVVLTAAACTGTGEGSDAPPPPGETGSITDPVFVAPSDDTGGGAGIGGAQDAGDGIDPRNTAPVAAFTIVPQCVQGFDSIVSLTSTSIDADGDPLSCEFTSSRGLPPTSNTCQAEVTYPVLASADTIELLVTDGRGGSDVATATLELCDQPPEQPPFPGSPGP